MLKTVTITTLLLLAGGVVARAEELDVNVKLLSGASAKGGLSGLSAESLALRRAAGDKSFGVRELLTVRPGAPVTPTKLAAPKIWIELVDGSTVQATRYRVTKGKAVIDLCDGRIVEASTRSLGAVRLKSQNLPQEKHLQKQWEEILQADASSDVIVIRKTSPAAGGDQNSKSALDYLEGVLYDITDDVAHFDYDGTRIPVNRQKVEGVVYYHAAGRELAPAICRVVTTLGNVWNVRSVVLEKGEFQLVSTAGVRTTINAAHVRLLDFSSGKVVYLSDLEEESFQVEIYLSADFDAEREKFKPQRDVSIGGQKPLRIADQTFDKGLAMVSRTELTYRLPGKYRRMLAVAGIDYYVDGNGGKSGEVNLIIFGDENTLYEGRINGADGPVPLDLDLTGVRRLKILVDYSPDKTKRLIANYLNLGEARITK